MTHLFRKEMNEHITIVEQYPPPAVGVETTQVERANIVFDLELLLQVVLNGPALPLVIDGSNNKIVGNRGLFPHI